VQLSAHAATPHSDTTAPSSRRRHLPWSPRGLATSAALLVASACYSPDAPTGLPCSSEGGCPSGLACSATEVCVDLTTLRRVRHDTAEDFSAVGAELDHAVVRPEGTVEPAASLTHALAVTAVPRVLFDDAATATWEAVNSAAAAGTAFLYASTESWTTTTPPPGRGLGTATAVTERIEGEVFLDAGTWKLELRGDDQAFIDLAEPGSATFRRLINAGVQPMAVPFEAKQAGWYPLRIAIANRAAAGSFTFRGSFDGAAPTVFDASRLRAPVAVATQGLIREVFESPQLLGWRSTSLVDSVRDTVFGTVAPPDAGVSDATHYGVRWSGQFLVDGTLDGFTLTSEGGHRLWIDGILRADKLTASSTNAIVGLGLVAGWHDLVFDAEKLTSIPFSVHITNPIGDPTAFESAKLRPVVGTAERWVSVRNTAADLIPDNGSVAKTLPPPSFEGVPRATSVEFEVNHTDLAEISLQLRHGAGATRTMAAAASLSGSGRRRFRYELDAKDFPPLVDGSWVFTANDTVATGATGDFSQANLTIQYRATGARSAPFATAMSYTSPLIDVGDIVALDKLSWRLNHPDAARVVAWVRSGASEGECQAAPWAAVNQAGISTAPPARFVQYRLALTSSGLVPVAIDVVTLEVFGR
jgi:hypothetical protein